MLSDAHGNDGAYRKGISLLRRCGAMRIAFLGDAVGYFAGTRVIGDLMKPGGPEIAIKGNHDQLLLEDSVPESRERIYRLGRVRESLPSSERRFLQSLPRRHELQVAERRLLFVHGAPEDELNGYLYPDTPLKPLREGANTTVFVGHTHRPFIRSAGGTTYVNVGSCGLPRDHGGLGAACLYDADTGKVTILRFPIEEETRAALGRGAVADEVLQVLARREYVEGQIIDDAG